MISPEPLIVMLSIWPAADPFWLIDEVAEGEAKLVIAGVLLGGGKMSQVKLFGAAPLAHVAGPLIVMSAAGAVSTPAPLNVSVARRQRDRRAGDAGDVDRRHRRRVGPRARGRCG